MFDYAVIGAGASGRLIINGILSRMSRKRIIWFDRDFDLIEKKNFIFYSLNTNLPFSTSWRSLVLYGNGWNKKVRLNKGKIFYVRGKDIKARFLSNSKSLTKVIGNVIEVKEKEGFVEICVGNVKYRANKVYDSSDIQNRHTYKHIHNLVGYSFIIKSNYVLEDYIYYDGRDKDKGCFYNMCQLEVNTFCVQITSLINKYSLTKARNILKNYLNKYHNIHNFEIVQTDSTPNAQYEYVISTENDSSKNIQAIGNKSGLISPFSGYAMSRIETNCKIIVENAVKSKSVYYIEQIKKYPKWVYQISYIQNKLPKMYQFFMETTLRLLPTERVMEVL